MVPLSRCAALLAALAAGCAVQVLETGEYAESFPPAGATRVVLEGLDGDVVVRGMAVDDVAIRGTRYSVGATRRAARAQLKHAALDADHAAADLVLAFDPPLALEGLVDLELDRVSTFPAQMGLEVAVEEGDLALDGLAGPLDVATGAGDVRIGDVGEADARAEAAGGGIEYALSAAGFFVECHAAGGAVTVDPALIAAGAARIDEADGTVAITRGDASKRVRLETRGGPIAVSLLAADDR